MSDFSRQYFKSLREFAPRLQEVIRTLAKDKIIIDKIQSCSSRSTPDVMIARFVYYDMC
jgi:hypothetical protein